MSTAAAPLFPRLSAVVAAVATVIAVLALRLVDLGVLRAGDGSAEAQQDQLRAVRGAIWDRRGALVAVERYAYRVDASPQQIADPAAFARDVAPLVAWSENELTALVSGTERVWVPLADEVDVATRAALAELDVPGLDLVRLARRAYPLDTSAAHLTGFVNADGVAYYGIEQHYDEPLRGRPGRSVGRFGSDPRAYEPARDGVGLILTIDRDLQVAAARLLETAVAAQDAKGGSVVVLDPASGAIIASTSVPSYDPNHYPAADPDAYDDPVVSSIYEPGSVIKVVTMAAALEAGIVKPESTYEDTGIVVVAGQEIKNADKLAHGTTTMTQLLQQSLNVGAVHVAADLGRDRFYAALRAFGIGARTGVDLAGEVTGTVHFPDVESDWYEGYLASNSFGQGMAVTPLQVACAIAAIANDGRLMRPHVVAARLSPDGSIAPTESEVVRQVVSPATARTLRAMLAEVVAGKVTQAAVPGYSVAGKTGTSETIVDGHYDDSRTIASFVGFVPAERPRVVILAKIDEPEAVRGSEVAAPLFAQVARAAIDILGVPPEHAIARAGARP